MSLTPYGPGKFSYLVDQVIYNANLASMEDEFESDEFETGNNYYLFRGGFDAIDLEDLIPEGVNLSKEDKDYLMNNAGFIASESEQGFFNVEAFKTKQELEDAWSKYIPLIKEDEDVS